MNYIVAGITFVVTALVAFAFHEIDVGMIRASQKNAIKTQSRLLISQCDQEKRITQQDSHEYEKQLSIANSRINSLHQSSVCVPIASTSSGHPSNTAIPRPSQSNGITSSALYDYAGDYQKERIQLVACQKFISDVYLLNKQP